MRGFASLLALLLVSSMACEERPTAREPNTSRPADPKPEQTATLPAVAPPKASANVFGRWKDYDVCLELYPSGAFELSHSGKGPKVVLIGMARQKRVDATHVELELRPTRIHSARWVSKCRKSVESAKVLDSYGMLGTQLSTSAAATLTLAMLPDDGVELCGTHCRTLAKDQPRLLGHWRREELHGYSSSKADWRPGEVADLHVKDTDVTLMFGADDGSLYELEGPHEIKVLDPGRFEVKMIPQAIAKRSGSEATTNKATAMGVDFVQGKPTTIRVERLGEGVEICGATSRCATLPHYDDLMR